MEEPDPNGPAQVSMDYAFMEPRPGGKANNEEEDVEEPADDEWEPEVRKKGMPILVTGSTRPAELESWQQQFQAVLF